MRLHTVALSCILVSAAFSADPALTIYNQQFAVVRETIPLDLKPGVNTIEFTGTTAELEPESVMLRGPSGRVLRDLAKIYRADAKTDAQTVEFRVQLQPGRGEDHRPHRALHMVESARGACFSMLPWASAHGLNLRVEARPAQVAPRRSVPHVAF